MIELTLTCFDHDVELSLAPGACLLPRARLVQEEGVRACGAEVKLQRAAPPPGQLQVDVGREEGHHCVC